MTWEYKLIVYIKKKYAQSEVTELSSFNVSVCVWLFFITDLCEFRHGATPQDDGTPEMWGTAIKIHQSLGATCMCH